MAITHIASSDSQNLGNGEAGGMTLTLPTHAADDFGLIFAKSNETGTVPVFSIGTATGWTELLQTNETSGQDRVTAVFYKKFTSSSETNPVVNVDTDKQRGCAVHVFRGVDTTTPFDAAAADFTQNSSGNTANPTNPSIITATDNAAIVLFHNFTHDDHTAIGSPSGYTDGEFIASGSLNHRGLAVAYDLDVGLLGTKTPGAWAHTADPTNVAEYTCVTIALRPAAAGGGDITITAGAVDALITTGNIPTVEIDHFRDVGLASLAFAGNTPSAEIEHNRDVSLGALAFTGNVPTLDLGSRVQLPDLGALAISGKIPVADPGSRTQLPTTGSLAVTGNAPSAEIGHKRDVDLGTIAFSSDAPVLGRSRSPGTGSLAFTGGAPSAEIEHHRDVGLGTAAFTGNAPTVKLGITALPTTRAVLLAGIAPSAEIEHHRDVGLGTLAITGAAPSLGRTRSPGTGSIAFTGTVPVIAGGDVTAEPGTGALALDGTGVNGGLIVTGEHPNQAGWGVGLAFTGQAPNTVIAGPTTAITPGTGSLTHDGRGVNGGLIVTGEHPKHSGWGIGLAFTGITPSIDITHIRDVPTGSLTLAGQQLTKVVPATASPGVGSITIDGTGVTGGVIVTGNDQDKAGWGVGLALTTSVPIVKLTSAPQPPTATLAITGTAPTANITHIRDVGLGTLALSSDGPQVLAGAGKIISPPKGDLTISPAAITAEITHIRDVGTASLTFTGAAPLISSVTAPTTAALTFASAAPTVNIGHKRDVGATSLTFSSDALTVIRLQPLTVSLNFTGYAAQSRIAHAGISITNANASTSEASNYEQCDFTGFRQMPGSLKLTWNKFAVRQKSWEERHPSSRKQVGGFDKQRGPKRPEQTDSFVDDLFPDGIDPEDL